jgi:hypothetical protein
MPPQSMLVNFRVQGVPQALGQIRQLSQQMRQLNGQMGGPGGGNTYNVYNYRGGGGSRGGGGGGRRSTFGSRLMGLIGSTRLNMGGASPLVGRMAGLFGPAASGPLTVAAAAATAPLTLLGGAAKMAADSLKQVSQNLATSGGRPGDFSRLFALGLNAQQAGDLSSRLRSNLSDPAAQLARAQLGLNPVSSSPFGQTNNAKILADTLERLAGVQNPDQQLRLARMLGVEDLLDDLRVSPGIRAQRQQDAARREGLMTPQNLQNARDFNALLKDTGDLFGEIKDVFGATLMQDATMFLRGFNDELRKLVPVLEGAGVGLRDTIREYFLKPIAMLAAVRGGQDPLAVAAGMDAAWAIQDAQAALTRAQQANTQALQQNTSAILNPGTYGGGSRARGALPAALLATAQAGGPSEFNRVMNGRSMALGAWSL